MKASNSPLAEESKRRGLLGALDFDKCSKSKKAEEVEYQLYSWGEVYAIFSGDRGHSTEDRHILRCFPFKLFSSSIPEGPLPQKLCLTFRNGIRLPESIVIEHFPRVKAEVMVELTERITKCKGEFSLQIPPLLTFERLVSYSLVEFLRKYENAGV